MNKRLLAIASFAAAGVLLLSGCAGAGAPQGTPEPSETATETPTTEPTDTASDAPELGVSWIAGGNAIVLQTFGSGSRNCYPNISGFGVNGNEVTIQIDPLPADQMCTMDYRAQLSLIELEGSLAQLDASQNVVVNVEYTDTGNTFEAGVLPAIDIARDVTQTPSAGWINQNSIALLTYGSGTTDCWPIVAGLDVPDGAQGALYVQIEPASTTGACTADFVPQLQEIYVEDGLIDPATVHELVLQGEGFEEQRISVAPALF